MMDGSKKGYTTKMPDRHLNGFFDSLHDKDGKDSSQDNGNGNGNGNNNGIIQDAAAFAPNKQNSLYKPFYKWLFLINGPLAQIFLIAFIASLCQIISNSFLLADAQSLHAFIFSLEITHTWNSGVVLGIAEQKGYILSTCGLALLLLLCLYVRKKIYPTHFPMTHLAWYLFMIGGAISNILDRIFNNGYVFDYWALCMNKLPTINRICTGAFNMADVFILIGTLGIYISLKAANKAIAVDKADNKTSS